MKGKCLNAVKNYTEIERIVDLWIKKYVKLKYLSTLIVKNITKEKEKIANGSERTGEVLLRIVLIQKKKKKDSF